MTLDSFSVYSSFSLGAHRYSYYSIEGLADKMGAKIRRLPKSLKILLECLLRNEDGDCYSKEHIEQFLSWTADPHHTAEIPFGPARVLMQDYTGVPAIVDLAAMRDAMAKSGGDPKKINPQVPVDLVIDHSVNLVYYGGPDAFKLNVKEEMRQNIQRYEFLKWGCGSFDNFRVVPPGSGICHQVNLEHLATVVFKKNIGGDTLVYPDTLVGTDSHTTMVNGLSVLGWGVGGIEAESVMLGQSISMLLPEVIGVHVTGSLPAGVTATDLVLTVTQKLREKKVVGKFVEFYGDGLANLSVADRATIANMAPEYGATCGFFPVDGKVLDYLRLTGKDDDHVSLVEEYSKRQGLWGYGNDMIFTDVLDLRLDEIKPSMAGPKRPQDRTLLPEVKNTFAKSFFDGKVPEFSKSLLDNGPVDGSVVIAAITSCTNTSNPSVIIGAALLARNAIKRGLKSKPWVKTSFAPGSQVVTAYLDKLGLMPYLEKLGFYLAGYGCTTCIGNSGPLKEDITNEITNKNLCVASVLSGNRNFEGRVHPLVKANYLASPPLVVAYALAGNINVDVSADPLGYDENDNPVYLRDIWPNDDELSQMVAGGVDAKMFSSRYSNVFDGDSEWKNIGCGQGVTYNWDVGNTYVQEPPYFVDFDKNKNNMPAVKDAYILGLFGDSITTDHISPAGVISKNSPAAQYLNSLHVDPKDYNSYGTRRGNHNVMVRGTFSNIRIRNLMLDGVEGGYTKCFLDGQVKPIYDAAVNYLQANKTLVIVAGKEYGTGSSRDWAAKGTLLLGVKAVIAESFERIHRSNLIGMGVVPVVFDGGVTAASLKLKGDERITIVGMESVNKPRAQLKCSIVYGDGSKKEVDVICAVNTSSELDCVRRGGILQKVLSGMLS